MALLDNFSFNFAVIISLVINNRFPQIPTAFIQIALGVVIFIIPEHIDFQFNSEVFMFAIALTTFCGRYPRLSNKIIRIS